MNKLTALVAAGVLVLAGCSSSTPAVKVAATRTPSAWESYEAARNAAADQAKAARKLEEDQAKAAADAETQRIRGEAPAFEVVEAPASGEDGEIRVTVDRTLTEVEAYSIMEVLVLDYTDEGGYFVSINCSSGGNATSDHRLANGKISVGAMGRARTGFVMDGQMVDLVKGATCP